MCGGQSSIPIVIRILIGRGWGQGPQHSQSLQAMFAHVPGLKVLMPTTPHDAKGLLIAAIEDNNPVIFLEHRWLHNIFGDVPEGYYLTPIGKARIARSGKDVTIIASSYMVLESLSAAASLAKEGIDAEVIDLRTIRPMDKTSILESVSKTGKAIVADLGWRSFGITAEIITLIAENLWHEVKYPPRRVTLPDIPTPCSPGLAKYYYPRAIHIVNNIREIFGLSTQTEKEAGLYQEMPLDIPNKGFTGPF
jgi:pyruvate dehydrogenase E1 component beta subunit